MTPPVAARAMAMAMTLAVAVARRRRRPPPPGGAQRPPSAGEAVVRAENLCSHGAYDACVCVGGGGAGRLGEGSVGGFHSTPSPGAGRACLTYGCFYVLVSMPSSVRHFKGRRVGLLPGWRGCLAGARCNGRRRGVAGAAAGKRARAGAPLVLFRPFRGHGPRSQAGKRAWLGLFVYARLPVMVVVGSKT